MIETLSAIPERAFKRQGSIEPVTPPDRDLFEYLRSWLDTPEHAYSSWINHQDLRPSTKTVYVSMFACFCKWMQGQGKRLDQIGSHDIRVFLDTSGQTGRQRQQYLRMLTRVYVRLGQLGHTGPNPAEQAHIEHAGQGKESPTRFLTHDETRAVLVLVKTRLDVLRREKKGPDAWIEYRDLALISAMLGGGLKVSHVLRLTLNCMDMPGERIELSEHHYTHRARLLPFAVAPIKAWLSLQDTLHDGTQEKKRKIFEGKRTADSGFGAKSKSSILSPSSIHRRVERFLSAAGITGDRACAQTLRNTYAALLIEDGASDDNLIDYLGLRASVTAKRLRAALALSRASADEPATAHQPL